MPFISTISPLQRGPKSVLSPLLQAQSTGMFNQLPIIILALISALSYGGFAVDLQKPGTIMVAALNNWWPQGIIFRSTDSGATWSRIWDWQSYRK